MKTTKRKHPTLEFERASASKLVQLVEPYTETDINVPAPCDGETFFVKLGRDVVGIVSLAETSDGASNELLITQLYVFPEFRGFGVGTDILAALSQFEGVHFLRVLATPSTAAYYEDRGFEQDAGHIVLTKVLI